MLEFLPLVASDSIPSSRLARHLTLRLHLHSALFNRCIAGMLLQKSVSPKFGIRFLFLSRIRMHGLDMIYAPDAPLSYECHYTSETSENQQRSLQRRGCGVLWMPCNKCASILQSARHPTRMDNATCTLYRFSAQQGNMCSVPMRTITKKRAIVSRAF